MDENKKIINQRETPLEVQIAELLISKGIHSLEQAKELLEPNFYAVIPMSILEKNTISANAKLLYAEITALSKKSGKCFATNEYLSERLGISKRTIPSLLKELKDNSLVLISIKKNKNGTYRDIFILPNNNGGASLNNDGGYREITIRGIAKERYQKRNKQIESEKENNIVEDPQDPNDGTQEIKKEEKPFNLNDYIKSLIDNPRRDLHIIGIYWQRKRPIVDNKKAAEKELKMFLKAGKELEDFSDDRIYETMNYLEDFADFKWNLYTVRKYITEDLDNLIYKSILKEGRNDPFRRKF